MKNLNAIFTIAYRDFIKLTRDKPRMAFSLIFPVIFIGVLGGSLQSNLSDAAGYNFLSFIFAGVLGQTLFQSTASGVISLIEDRENDFSQEIFVSPISRYSIIVGKILGESLVALTQLVGIIGFGFLMGVSVNVQALLSLVPFFLIVCMFGGAFGVVVLSNLKNQRSANQIFPFVIFPQFFLSGVFSPIMSLPPVLYVLSRIAPMTYAVDLVRSIYFLGDPAYKKMVLFNTGFDLLVIAGYAFVFIIIGTFFFIRNEKNR